MGGSSAPHRRRSHRAPAAKFVTKALHNQEHPLHIYIEAEKENPHHRASHQKSWVAKAVATYKKLTATPHQDARLQAPQDAPSTAHIAAPWDKSTLTFNYNTDIPVKHTSNAQHLKAMALESLTPDNKPVYYTDGSVMDNQAAAGIAHDGETTAVRLNNGASILQDELAAIKSSIFTSLRIQDTTQPGL